MSRFVTTRERAEWDAEYRAGRTMLEIAAAAGRSEDTVHRHLRTIGTPIRPRGRVRRVNHSAIVKKLADGIRAVDLASAYGLGQRHVSRIKRRAQEQRA